MELLNSLGINGKLLIAQIINFLILLFVLYKFAYGPVLKMLDERTKKIEKGIKDAENSGKKLEEIAAREKGILDEAKKQAKEIVRRSEDAAVAQAEELVMTAKDQTQKMVETAREQIEQEKNKILVEAKAEIAGLVMVATEKIIGEKLDPEKDAQLIKNAIK